MAKSILAGVGVARGLDNQANMIVRAKALTDEGFNISTSKEEIRGGQGASLQGQYFHTTQFSVTLKDAIFDLNYLALQVGGKIEQGGDIFVTEQCTVDSSNKIKVQGTPKAFGGFGIVGWASHTGKDDVQTITFNELSNKQATLNSVKNGDKVCVTYVQTDDSARVFKVASSYIPSEIHLIFDMPLFNAGAMNKENMSTESQIGTLTVDIPRFQFNGSVDLSSAMATASAVDISGVALQAGVDDCSGKGIYATITEHIKGRDEFESVYAIVVEDSDIELKNDETQTLKVIALHNDGTAPHVVDNKKLTFSKTGGSSTVNDGVVTGKTGEDSVVTVTVKNHEALKAKAVVHIIV